MCELDVVVYKLKRKENFAELQGTSNQGCGISTLIKS